MATKYCSRCDQTKAVAEFSKDRTTKDGLSARCKECRSDYSKRWYNGLTLERQRERRDRRRNERSEWQRAYYHRNREWFAERGREWVSKNREKHRANTRRNMQKRRATAKGRLENNVSRAVYRALKGRKGGEPTFALLEYTVEQLMAHLERQFQRGMCWDNYGKWHVDHIRPLVSFEYSEPSDPEFKRAWALTNLRPLWARENISKGGRVSLLI
jgi:hypothetical protein